MLKLNKTCADFKKFLRLSNLSDGVRDQTDIPAQDGAQSMT